MDKEAVVHSFSLLGDRIAGWLRGAGQAPGLAVAVQESINSNSWFTTATIKEALSAIAHDLLDKQRLQQWLGRDAWAVTPKRVGVVMAGNIPLVGFHDFLCVLASGNIFVGKLSSRDAYLLPALSDLLVSINPAWSSRIKFVKEIPFANIDALIATGSDSTAHHFESAAAAIPHLIRHNRRSVALLSGNETRVELDSLAKDIFSYYGLGCRNVSMLYVPAGYDWQPLLDSWKAHADIMQHKGYANNYCYQKAMLTMQQSAFIAAAAALLVENPSLQAPPAVVHYCYYTDPAEALKTIEQQKNAIQCVAVAGDSDKFCTFGATQRPALYDYADGKDTMRWLLFEV